MISDGYSNYPEKMATRLYDLLKSIKKIGCTSCARCYFIKKYPYSSPSYDYEKLCQTIGA